MKKEYQKKYLKLLIQNFERKIYKNQVEALDWIVKVQEKLTYKPLQDILTIIQRYVIFYETYILSVPLIINRCLIGGIDESLIQYLFSSAIRRSMEVA